jgi:hypothetical protein
MNKKMIMQISTTNRGACVSAKQGSANLFGGKGQVAIETTAAIIAVFIFLLGVLQIFVWFNSMLVERQKYYQDSRSQAARGSPGIYNWQAPRLDIFGSSDD